MFEGAISKIPVSERLQVGPFFFGVVWNWFLLGVLILQLYLYYLRRRRDSIWIRAVLVFVVAMDLAETGLTTHGAFEIFVNYWGVPEIVVFLPKTFLTLPLCDAIIASVVQCFYGWRIWILSRDSYRRFLAPLVFFLAFMQSIACLVSTVLLERADDQTQLAKLNPGFVLWLSSNVVVDVIIAVTMIFILRSAKSETYFSRTHDILSRLLRQTITTGVATATCTILVLGLFLHKNGNNAFDTPTYVLGKLYSNSLLANLNARPDTTSDGHSIPSGHSGGDTSDSHELSALSPFRARSRNRPQFSALSSVQVSTNHEQTVDGSPVLQISSTKERPLGVDSFKLRPVDEDGVYGEHPYGKNSLVNHERGYA